MNSAPRPMAAHLDLLMDTMLYVWSGRTTPATQAKPINTGISNLVNVVFRSCSIAGLAQASPSSRPVPPS